MGWGCFQKKVRAIGRFENYEAKFAENFLHEGKLGNSGVGPVNPRFRGCWHLSQRKAIGFPVVRFFPRLKLQPRKRCRMRFRGGGVRFDCSGSSDRFPALFPGFQFHPRAGSLVAVGA